MSSQAGIGAIIAAVVAIAASAGAAALAGGAVWAAYGATTAAYVGAIAAVSTYVSASIAQRNAQKAAQAADIQGPTLASFRSANEPRQIIYGKVRTGGPLAYIGNARNNGEIGLSVMLAGHECTAIDEVWLDEYRPTLTGPSNITFDRAVHYEWVENPGDPANPTTIEVVDNAGTPTAVYYETFPGRYNVRDGFKAFFCELDKLGASTQTVSQLLKITSGGKWTDNHRLRGICHLPVLLSWAPDIFKSGPPNITAVVRGKKLYDPRKDSTNGGSGAHRLATPATWEYSTNSALCVLDYILDTRLGLGAAASEVDFATFRAAADVCAEVVDLVGGGAEGRYETNGVLRCDATHEDNLLSLLSAMDGRLVYSGGKFRVYAGKFVAPTVTLTEDDLASGLVVQAQAERSKLVNAVRGQFSSPANNWQQTDYPPLQNASYYAADGGEWLWLDLPLPMTNSAATCQRLAKIAIERSRRQIVVQGTFKLSAMQVMPGETVYLTMDRYGWASKPFTVEDWRFVAEEGDEGPALAVALTLREIDQAVFNWTAAEEAAILPVPSTNLPNPFVVDAPASVNVSSRNALQQDGTVISRLRIRWTQSDDYFVRSGGYAVVQWKLQADVDWNQQGQASGDAYEFLTQPVLVGQLYDVRVRFENSSGTPSTWTTASSVTPTGDVTAPGVVSSFAFTTRGDRTRVFSWTYTPPADFSYYELRYGTAGQTWAEMTVLATGLSSPLVELNIPVAGTYDFAVAAFDTSGNRGTVAYLADRIVPAVPDVFRGGIGANWLNNDNFAAQTNTLGQASYWRQVGTDGAWTTEDSLLNGGVGGRGLKFTMSGTANPTVELHPLTVAVDPGTTIGRSWAVEAGKRYQWSAYAGSSGMSARVFINWYDGAGSFLSASTDATNGVLITGEGKTGGSTLDLWKRIHVVANAPANAKYAIPVFARSETVGTSANGAYMRVLMPFWSEAHADQVGPSQWSPGTPGITSAVIGPNAATTVITATRANNYNLPTMATPANFGTVDAYTDISTLTLSGGNWIRTGSISNEVQLAANATVYNDSASAVNVGLGLMAFDFGTSPVGQMVGWSNITVAGNYLGSISVLSKYTPTLDNLTFVVAFMCKTGGGSDIVQVRAGMQVQIFIPQR